MSRALRAASTGAAVAGLVFALPLACWTWRLNPHQSAMAVVVLGFDFWLTSFVILFPSVLLVDVVRGRLGRPATAGTSLVTACAVLFFLLWFFRIESAHKPLSVNPHLGWSGALALLAMAAASALIWLAALRRRWIVVAVAIILSSVALELLARAQTPGRMRDGAVARVSAQLARTPDSPSLQAGGNRVLFIGIDGMDWRSASTLMDAGELPALQRLLRNGRYYQMDNFGLRESPEIWTAIYTRLLPPESGVDNFVYWYFRGLDQPIIALPRFGFHSVLFIDRFLSFLRVGLWRSELVTNTKFKGTPVWATLSAANRRVLAFEPMLARVPEEINGTFAVNRPGLHVVYSPRGRVEYSAPTGPSNTGAAEIRNEQRRRAVAADVLRRESFDAMVYYTGFLDGVQHYEWRKVCDGCQRSPRFLTTTIAAGYREADRTIAELIDAFGQPATVVLVSDHGWDYADYEHFASPMGMYVVSPSPTPGYGGIMPATEITPSILALAQVDATARVAQRTFINDRPRESEIRKRLHSLGYIGN